MLKEIMGAKVAGTEVNHNKSSFTMPSDEIFIRIDRIYLHGINSEFLRVLPTPESEDQRERTYTEAYIRPEDFYAHLAFFQISSLTPNIIDEKIPPETAHSIEHSA